jgi:hypothetical protein
MGFKSKFLFLLIVYFAGFATAVYHLSPDGRVGPETAFASGGSEDQGQSKAVDVLTSIRDKTYGKVAARFANMDREEFKAAFDRGMEAVRNMARSSQSSNQSSNGIDGGEDK